MTENNRDALTHIAQSVFKEQTAIRSKYNGYNVADIVKTAKSKIETVFHTAEKKVNEEKPLSLVEEYIYDNYYFFDKTVRITVKGLKNIGKLPYVIVPCGEFGAKTLPLHFFGFYKYIGKINYEISEESVSAYLEGASRASVKLSYVDYYSLGTLWTGCLLCVLGELADNNENKSIRAVEKVTLGIRLVMDFTFEKYLKDCPAERVLRLDPCGVYCNMTEETKNIYRYNLIKNAQNSGLSEKEYAEKILFTAREADTEKKRHMGYYLYPRQKKSTGVLYFCILYFLWVAFLSLVLALGDFHPIMLLTAIPVLQLVKELVTKAFSFFVPSIPLPKLDIKSLSHLDGVITVITTIMGDAPMEELFSKLEDMYNASGLDNTFFAILGDYPENSTCNDKEQKSFSLANERISALNLKYGCHFFLLVRHSTYNPGENIFMGYERKRGAIGALNDLLTEYDKAPFIQCENLPSRDVCEKIRFVITLDSDTNLPPDAIRELTGIMLHPLNRPEYDENGVIVEGHGLLQPAVTRAIDTKESTAFSHIFGGAGGFEIYNFSAFELYQSVFGEGTFCGKGIFDKEAFKRCIQDKNVAFPENTILSHDILEGARLRAGNVMDLSLSDGFPRSSVSYLKRHHRWVRGDTQNLIFLKKYVKNRDGQYIKNNISLLSKYKILDNFIRATLPIFSYMSIVLSCFLAERQQVFLVLFSVLYIAFEFISNLGAKIATVGIESTARKYFSKTAIPGLIRDFYKLICQISMLPSLASVSFDAICKSLYRMIFSKRKLLEWTTSGMGEKELQDSFLYYVRKNTICWLSGGLIYVFDGRAFIKLLGIMWFLFPLTAFCLARPRKRQNTAITLKESRIVTEYARKIWDYFVEAVTEKSNYIPVDNIQLYPTGMISEKTSPTNIGLYLLSTLAARDFSFIDTTLLYNRIEKTIGTIEKLKKYYGNLYNWYDTTNINVIAPYVISSVDSGNFLACLICLKEGLKDYVHEKAELLDIIVRLEGLIDKTSLDKLYDHEKKLFYIDLAVTDSGECKSSGNHFDMLMSEARTLSYVAISKGQAPIKHYSRLSRPMLKHSDRIGVASWTGTAFEYFMPTLLMPVVKGSLIYEALRFALYRQKARRASTKKGGVFGISESGYYRFDENGVYQYKAFGVADLGLKSGLDRDLVISPYSCFLFFSLDKKSALENLDRLKKCGMWGKYGFYEAMDCTPSRSLKPEIVASYMSHHQGMSMIACANAVFDNVFVKRFMSDPQIRSIRQILEEKIPIDCMIKDIKPTSVVPERIKREKN